MSFSNLITYTYESCAASDVPSLGTLVLMPDRWSSLAVCLLVELAAGTVYGFGSYSEKIKEVLGGDQAAVNLVSSIGQVGLYVTFFGGMFYDRFGNPTLQTPEFRRKFEEELGMGIAAPGRWRGVRRFWRILYFGSCRRFTA